MQIPIDTLLRIPELPEPTELRVLTPSTENVRPKPGHSQTQNGFEHDSTHKYPFFGLSDIVKKALDNIHKPNAGS